MMEAIVRRTRRAAVDSFAAAVQVTLRDVDQPSERDFRDAWLQELRRHDSLLADGWYDPPPHGLSVLIAHPPNYATLAMPSIRPPHAWPHESRRWSPNCVMYAYGSPIDADTGLVGDFAVVLYAGKDERVADHLRRCRRVATTIAQRAEVGMPFATLHADAMAQLQRHGYANDIVSSTDPAGTNIGHTVPFTDRGRTPREELPNASDAQLRHSISPGRIFISAVETRPIAPGTVLTVEPRMGAVGLPTVGYHFMVAFGATGHGSVIDELQPAEDAYSLAVAERRSRQT